MSTSNLEKLGDAATARSHDNTKTPNNATIQLPTSTTKSTYSTTKSTHGTTKSAHGITESDNPLIHFQNQIEEKLKFNISIDVIKTIKHNIISADPSKIIKLIDDFFTENEAEIIEICQITYDDISNYGK